MDLSFFDANVAIGSPMNAPDSAATVEQLLAAMDRAGIDRAVVWHVAQQLGDPETGNALLGEAIAGHRDRLVGCWSLLPPQTGELGEPNDWFNRALDAGVSCFRAWPEECRFLLRREVMGRVFEIMIARRLPLILSGAGPDAWKRAYDLMADFPELTLVLGDIGCWGADRFFRPLIETYPAVHIDISDYFLDGGLDAFVADYGPDRLLFGSGYPTRYMGAMMLALATADISESDKASIASGNLQRLMKEVRQ